MLVKANINNVSSIREVIWEVIFLIKIHMPLNFLGKIYSSPVFWSIRNKTNAVLVYRDSRL